LDVSTRHSNHSASSGESLRDTNENGRGNRCRTSRHTSGALRRPRTASSIAEVAHSNEGAGAQICSHITFK
jgi:hypothetical protein